jgi:RNA-binding protein
MDIPALTGSQKSRLRALGQRMEPTIKVGKDGMTPAIVADLGRQLGAHELVKLRFAGLPRDERAALCDRLAAETGGMCVGSVGQTALFFVRAAGAKSILAVGK